MQGCGNSFGMGRERTKGTEIEKKSCVFLRERNLIELRKGAVMEAKHGERLDRRSAAAEKSRKGRGEKPFLKKEVAPQEGKLGSGVTGEKWFFRQLLTRQKKGVVKWRKRDGQRRVWVRLRKA